MLGINSAVIAADELTAAGVQLQVALSDEDWTVPQPEIDVPSSLKFTEPFVLVNVAVIVCAVP